MQNFRAAVEAKKKHLIFLMLLPENNISQADDLGLIDFEKQ